MSTDIYDQQLNSQTYLENIIEIIPYFIFWKNVDSVYLGCNQKFATLVGEKSPKAVVGKTDFELGRSKEEVEVFRQGDRETMSGMPTINAEEIVLQPDGSKVVMLVNKIPLMDARGHCIGVLGTSTDITELKHTQFQIATEKEKLIALAHKVAHDISSPLSALSMMVPMCKELPENKRTLLKRATDSILDIANNLLSTYRQQIPTESHIEPCQPLLISDLLIQLLSEKKVQYQQHSVRFETEFASDAQFAFVRIQPTEFRRSLSNLINNAVEAVKDHLNGKVIIHLTADANAVTVEIQDNGKGMTAAMIQKIQNRQGFTDGKENGHGLGLQQVWDTLEYNQGIMEVKSVLGKSTSIQLTFSRIGAANWIAQDIHIISDNVIVILDDDESIHTAWDLRFSSLLASSSSLQIHHFTQGQEALNFLARLSPTQKDRVILFTDYELLNQNKNGLEVVKESGLKHAMLVTSYYSEAKIREETGQLGIKILPKQMASIVPILFVPTGIAKLG
jgi:PAS domain S-box-containing protein